MSMRDNRGFMVSTKTIKKHWFRENEISIEITDGANNITFYNVGSFTVATNAEFPEKMLIKDY